MLSFTAIGMSLVLLTTLVNDRFDRARGLALAILLTGSGLTGFLLPVYTAWLVNAFGWRTAYIGLSFLPPLLVLPTLVILREQVPTFIHKKNRSMIKASQGKPCRRRCAIIGFGYLLC